MLPSVLMNWRRFCGVREEPYAMLRFSYGLGPVLGEAGTYKFFLEVVAEDGHITSSLERTMRTNLLSQSQTKRQSPCLTYRSVPWNLQKFPNPPSIPFKNCENSPLRPSSSTTSSLFPETDTHWASGATIEDAAIKSFNGDESILAPNNYGGIGRVG